MLCFVLYFGRTFLLVFLFYKFNLCRGVSPAQVFLCVFFGVSVICEFLFWCEMYVMSVFLIYFSHYLIWIYFLFFDNNDFYFDNFYFFKRFKSFRTNISLGISLFNPVIFFHFFFIIYAFHFILLSFLISDFSIFDILLYFIFIPIISLFHYVLFILFIFLFLICYYAFASMLSVVCRFVCFYIFVIDMFCCLLCDDKSWVGQLLFSKDVCFLFVCITNQYSYLLLFSLLIFIKLLSISMKNRNTLMTNNNGIISKNYRRSKIYIMNEFRNYI